MKTYYEFNFKITCNRRLGDKQSKYIGVKKEGPFKSKGYKHWGTNPNYALVDGKNIKGFYFLKQLK